MPPAMSPHVDLTPKSFRLRNANEVTPDDYLEKFGAVNAHYYPSVDCARACGIAITDRHHEGSFV